MDEYIRRAGALEIVKRTNGDYATAFSEIANLAAVKVDTTCCGGSDREAKN